MRCRRRCITSKVTGPGGAAAAVRAFGRGGALRCCAAALLCCRDRPRLRADGSARPALFERGVQIQGKSRIWDKGIAAGRCERRRLKGGGVGAAWRRLCSLGGFV